MRAAASQTKTWAQLEAEIATTMRRWHVWDYTLDSSFAKLKAVERRKAMKAGQSPEQRAVTLRFDWSAPGTYRRRSISLTVNSDDTALENLERLAKSIEQVRMAEVRQVHKLVTLLYRQMYPEPARQQEPPPPKRERVNAHGPYAALHLADDAPLEVAEAAYRALVKTAHPDFGGSHAAMIVLNAAIEQIRAAKARR